VTALRSRRSNSIDARRRSASDWAATIFPRSACRSTWSGRGATWVEVWGGDGRRAPPSPPSSDGRRPAGLRAAPGSGIPLLVLALGLLDEQRRHSVGHSRRHAGIAVHAVEAEPVGSDSLTVRADRSLSTRAAALVASGYSVASATTCSSRERLSILASITRRFASDALAWGEGVRAPTRARSRAGREARYCFGRRNPAAMAAATTSSAGTVTEVGRRSGASRYTWAAGRRTSPVIVGSSKPLRGKTSALQ